MKWTFYLCLITILLLTSSSHAEFQINTHTTNNQTFPDMAMDANENFIAVWSSYRQDSDSGGIFAQLFDANNLPEGSEFQVNTETAGNQTRPSVAMDAAGNFIVVWEGPNSVADTNEDVFAQRFDSTGQPLGTQFIVNNSTFSRLQNPKVSMNKFGKFV